MLKVQCTRQMCINDNDMLQSTKAILCDFYVEGN